MPIHIEGAAENNLRDIDLTIEDGITAVTGVSGSGKSSLIFDVLYHEARRRFLDSFASPSSGLRLAPAKVRSISGLPPAVAVGQNLLNRNPASSVASASGLHPFFRLLFAREGLRECASCGRSIRHYSDDEIMGHIKTRISKERIDLYVPILKDLTGSHSTLLDFLKKEFNREAILVDGKGWDGTTLEATGTHSIAIRLASLEKGVAAGKLRELLAQAAALGAPTLSLAGSPAEVGKYEAVKFDIFPRAPLCPDCGHWYGELDPVAFHSPCPHCGGTGCGTCKATGLVPEAAAVRWKDLRFTELLRCTVEEAVALFQGSFSPPMQRLYMEIQRRLGALQSVGLAYLGLDRPVPTLSRGEAQRLRLAVTLVSRLSDLLHIFDEPTVGLHPADLERLLPVFRSIPGPVVYVEHDRNAVAAADRAADLGPGPGREGGRLVYSGTAQGLWKADTPTGFAFSGKLRKALYPGNVRADRFIIFRGARSRNLRGIDVAIPVGQLTALTGVSGSGKSTLAEEVMLPSLKTGKPVGCDILEGPILYPTVVDQAPIGKNPRSNAATYTGLAPLIRRLFSSGTGLEESRFSFNNPDGACPSCGGLGSVEQRLSYLPSEWVPCADCGGRRFSEEVLSYRADFSGRSFSIAEFLELSVRELPDLLESSVLSVTGKKKALRILSTLMDVGLGYLPIGQTSPTLSGGEAQRVKLAKHLGEKDTNKRFIILDEPSTGLHPADVQTFLGALRVLTTAGATVVVIEHDMDIVSASDWVIDLGPSCGVEGGALLYSGKPAGLATKDTPTGRALRDSTGIKHRVKAYGKNRTKHDDSIGVHGARANNLRNLSLSFPKGRLTVVSGVSGSGKSSLVHDVLETEASRRYLESLSMYERQSVREGAQAEAKGVDGLGLALGISSDRGYYDPRTTVGTATELSYNLAVLLSFLGTAECPSCASPMDRNPSGSNPSGKKWICPGCKKEVPAGQPRHFIATNYAAACKVCQGVGFRRIPAPGKLIIYPEKPLLSGAMYSPGFFPKGYLGKKGNGGYDLVMALASRYGFDPFQTPWTLMGEEARKIFLYGGDELLDVRSTSPKGKGKVNRLRFPGFYGWLGDWDLGGTYTETVPCEACGGSRLREEFAHVSLAGHNPKELGTMPVKDLAILMDQLTAQAVPSQVRPSLESAVRKTEFLRRVGLPYLHLDRPAATLSAGEAQRIRLAGLLSSGLRSLTVLLDEPSRGLHPQEVACLFDTIQELRNGGNTVIVVEHEPSFIRKADYVVDLGPGAGRAGGSIVVQGSPEEIQKAPKSCTASWLRGERKSLLSVLPRRIPDPGRTLTIKGARGNNLRGGDVHIPLGCLVGICGVSGSGKSTLIMDTLERALAPKKHTTSVAREPLEPLEYDVIEGAPEKVLSIDQSRVGIHSPGVFLGLSDMLISLFAKSPEARAIGLSEAILHQGCSVCSGRGFRKIDMGFLPAALLACETCGATGFTHEARDLRMNGVSLPDLFARTLEEVRLFLCSLPEEDRNVTTLDTLDVACTVGLGYLVFNQTGWRLSGGEAQRLRIASELRKKNEGTLFILDEPTVGLHMEDIERLGLVLHSLAPQRSVLAVEHCPQFLAACDWLIELGPGGGPEGGSVIATGNPEALATGNTPIAPYLREWLP